MSDIYLTIGVWIGVFAVGAWITFLFVSSALDWAWFKPDNFSGTLDRFLCAVLTGVILGSLVVFIISLCLWPLFFVSPFVGGAWWLLHSYREVVNSKIDSVFRR